MADKLRALLEFIEIETTSGSGAADDLEIKLVVHDRQAQALRFEFYDGTVLLLTPEVEVQGG